MAYYRDRPQTSSDLQNYYDNPSTQAGYPAQNPFDSSHNLPPTPAGVPMTTRGDGAMYTQAAANSTYDVSRTGPGSYGAPPVDQSYKPSDWLGDARSGNKRSKWIVIGSVAGLLLLIAIGVGVGVGVSRNSKPSNSGGSSKPPKNQQTDPNDPSTFIKNPKLRQSFYGLAYTPADSQLPNCGNKLSDVIQDIQLISQLTTRIRLYGGDCNQSAVVLEAIKQTKVDLKVYLGNYVVATDNGVAYQRQRDAIKSAIQTYGTDHIAGITVGNEFMLNYLNANGAGDAQVDSDIGNAGADILLANIQDTRSMLSDLNVQIPVGTSDAGSFFNTKVLSSVDYGMANVHPWFANTSESDAAGWTADFFNLHNVMPASALSNRPQMYIAETGWPTKSSDKGNEKNGPGTASEAGLQTFLKTFVCQANANNTGYFFFEFFDEPWKDAQFGGVEGWWGLFTSNRTLKNIEIPDCGSP